MPQISTKRLPATRTEATITFSSEEVFSAETRALEHLSTNLRVAGFRPRKVPAEIAREKIKPEDLLEETIHFLLPKTFEQIMREHALKPIIQPRVALQSRSPLTITITFIEAPAATINTRKVKADLSVVTPPSGAKADLKDIERVRRESALLDLIAKHTAVDLAPELVADETQRIIDELGKRLSANNITFDQYLAQSKLSRENFAKDLKSRAENRLKTRFGIRALLDEERLEISDDEMAGIVREFLAPLSIDERLQIAPSYAKGAENFEQLRWQKRVERLMERMFAQG